MTILNLEPRHNRKCRYKIFFTQLWDWHWNCRL